MTMRSRQRNNLVTLVLMLGVVALIAQLAGVGAKRPHDDRGPRLVRLATLPGATVPDSGSTSIMSTSVRARAEEAVRMTGTATLAATHVPPGASAQVVCGIRYSRAGDPAWTLGAAYEQVTLGARGTLRKTVTIERSFAAPAADRYSMTMACHVSSPASGARVSASGSMDASLGLPPGAATPAD